MGARIGRMVRNFNLENRTFREISKEKPTAAPRHAAEAPPPAVMSEVKQKNEPLLGLLRSVYVESTDPAAAETEASAQEPGVQAVERRPLKYNFPGPMMGLTELTDVPKGKLTVAEALKALGGHHHQPHTWTPEKIAQEYSLDLKDTQAALKYFIPFRVEIIPPKSKTAKQITDS
ncbi:NADH dehydrogenase [ubiquinone] 1 alpha subcomplex assembly factor 4 [Cololabis saira]|uniref:NADH dehydrogenase [ubiquinone] 1 alpha subcomplex assembly factor 4 n=1 Tax=Cololabis saira TaxID=129043 RepID=UPI002AD2A28B|nr:NADH dehydrogenase [ubiquinone] 1 alpha subcomplex assembly factor 4 [Cololabis saira]